MQYRSRKFAPSEVLWGEDITELRAQEHGLEYHISLGKAQNSGLFLDMGNGREWVKNNSEGKNVLNLFAYTCAFSVAAIAGGAKHRFSNWRSQEPIVLSWARSLPSSKS